MKKRIPKRERQRLVNQTRKAPDDEVRREELLRPSPYLGYDRVQIAVHLLEREAYPIAEAELRRAIWLNPYEPAFKLHLGFCLYRQRRYKEAREILEAMGDDEKYKKERTELLALIQSKYPEGR